MFPELTLKERWNPVTSVILFCTILASIWVDYFGCGGSVFLFWFIKLHFSETRVVVSERVASDHTALVGQLAAAL